MKHGMKQSVFVAVWLLMVLAGCTTAPITGRSQFITIPDSVVNSMALDQYNTFLKSDDTELSTDPEKTAMVQRVGIRIAGAVEDFMTANNMQDRIDGYNWEFNVVESDQVNAWAMPGGKVVVYTGILDVAEDEAGLAVIMGHEIAHAVARHGSERMSQALAVSLGGVALNEALRDRPSQTRQLFLASYGVGATVGIMLPYSRTHENEADRMGLIFMAMAGYPPEAAIGFWERMAASKEGAGMPEFLSTHPADATRIQNIRSHLYEARRYYRPYNPNAGAGNY